MLYLAFLIPLFVALIYLFSALAFKTDTVFHGTLWFHLPPLVIAAAPLAWLILKYGRQAVHSNNNFWLYMCFLTPFALIYPWVITGSTAPGYGGFLYFMEWLTKNPNAGPVNIQVFIGILCMISIAFIPSFYAYQALSHKPRTSWLLALFSVGLIAFTPVFIQLDLMLWISGFVDTPTPARNSNGLHGLDLLYGPLLHTTPLLIMSWHVVSTIIKKPANYY